MKAGSDRHGGERSSWSETLTQLFKPFYRTDEILERLRPVLDRGWTGYGPHSKQFESQWSDYLGVKHSHFVNSCTAALHLALTLLKLPKQSKVLTTPFTFV